MTDPTQAATKPEKETEWEYSTYQVLQLLPADGWKEVFAMECEDDRSKCELQAYDIDFLAVACETTITRRGVPGSWSREKSRDTQNRIVGVTFENGYEIIGAESDNYAGLTNGRQPLSEITGCLHWKYQERLRTENEP